MNAGLKAYYKAKNAEHQGLRFSISFTQMSNELRPQKYEYFFVSNTFLKKINGFYYDSFS